MPGQIGQSPDRLEGQGHGGEERHEFARGPFACGHFAAAQHQDGKEADPGDHVDKCRHGGATDGGLDLGPLDRVDDAPEAVGLIGFHAVQLDGLNAVEDFVQPGCAQAGLFAGQFGLAA